LPLIVLAMHWGNLAAIVMWEALVLTIFGCVILHELGHALMARYFGIPTRDVTLYPIGGVARLEQMPENPLEEILIAVAGPAVNVAIAMILLLGTLVSGVSLPSVVMLHDVGWDNWAQTLLLHLMIGNVVLVIFNMLPIFPMDGGRVFRAVLAVGLGHLRATEIASMVGMILAGFLGLGLLLTGNLLAPLVVFIAILAGRAELAMVRAREAKRRAAEWDQAVEVLPVDEPAYPVYAPPPEPNFSGYTWDRFNRVWVEWRNGQRVAARWQQQRYI
jgi:Zn-dependent protease